MIAPRSALNIALLCAGFLVWSSAFLSLYAALSLGCAFGWEDIALGPVSVQRAVLIGLWLVHLALIAALVAFARRRSRRAEAKQDLGGFFAGLAFWGSIAALGASVVNYAPVLGLSACL